MSIRHSRMRWFVTLVAMALVVAACGDDAATTTTTAAVTTTTPDSGETTTPDEDFGTFKVGLLNPTTGVFAVLGGDTNIGFELFLEERGGQLSGWTIETVLEDDAGDPTTGGTRARKLIEQDQVDALIGGVSSAVAYGIADLVQESGIPYIITIAGADGLTQQDASDNIFRISYTGSQPMHPLAEYACNTLGYETATVVSLDFAFGWETAGGFGRVYEDEGCDVVQEIYVPLGTEDYAPFVQQISRDTDVVVHVNSGPSGNLFWQTYRDFGYEQPVIGHGAITDEFLLANDEDWTIGAQTVFYWSRALDNALNRSLVEAFEARTGTLTSQGAEAGYAAGMVLEAALAVAGADANDPAALADALRQVEVEAPRGPLRFDEYNQAVMNFYIREVQAVEGDPMVNKANVVIETFPDVSQFWILPPEEYLGLPVYTDLKGTWGN